MWLKRFSGCVHLRMELVSSTVVLKLLEGVVPMILLFFHESAYKFLLRLKVLVFPLQRHQFLGKVYKLKVYKWLLKLD